MKGILFLIYVFVEVVVTFPIAGAVGLGWTFVEIILSALVGITVLMNTPFKFQESIQKITASRLSLSTFSLASTIRVLGAFLLILPGFFGDMVGAILLIFSALMLVGEKPNQPKKDDEDIIDVEIIEDNK